MSRLEVLKLNDVRPSPDGMRSTMMALRESSCPSLHTLELHGVYVFGDGDDFEEDDVTDYGQVLGEAMDAGHLERLQHLDIYGTLSRQLAPVARALERKACPLLRSLVLLSINTAGRDALAALIMSGAIPLLEKLKFTWDYYDEPGNVLWCVGNCHYHFMELLSPMID